MNNNQVKSITSINEETTDCKSNWNKLCTGIPLFVKIIILITILLSVLNIFFPGISFYFANIHYYTIYNFQIWRIFITSLIMTNIINVIIAILFWVKHASNLEDIMGTIKYLLIFIVNSTIIQIFSTAVFFVISIIIKNKNFLKNKINSKGKVNNCGIWPYIVCELTLLSLSNPNHSVKFLFLPHFKAKFYPIIVLVVFCTLNNPTIDLEILCSLIYSFIYYFFIKKRIKITNNFARKIENLFCVQCCRIFGGFVNVNKDSISSTNNKRKIRDVEIQQNKKKGFVPFTGEETGTVSTDSMRQISKEGNHPINDAKTS